jgi:hypothetical protein
MSDRLRVPQRNGQRPDRTPAECIQDEAIQFWQPRLRRKLTREDARQITENLTGFFRVLESWQKVNPATGVDYDAGKQVA